VSDSPAHTVTQLPPQSRDLLRWAQMAGLVRMRLDGTWHLTDLGRKSAMRLVAQSPVAKAVPPSIFKDM
jgi:hypothetical protein